MLRPPVCGSKVRVGVGVELGKELLQGEQIERHHPGLVAVVAGAPVPFVEGVGDGELGEFLAVAENAELGFAGEHLAPPDDGRLARAVTQAVIRDDLGGRERKFFGQV